MSASTILQIVPVLFVLVVLVVAFVKHQSARQQQTQGVLWLQAMRMLVTHIQRHRGLSVAVLSGDLSVKSRLDETQIQVSRDFQQISSVGDWIMSHEGWQLITQHWARLAGNIYKLKVERNIDQHNKLIKNILVLVDEIALQHHLSGQIGFRATIWRELLTLAELLGQTRAFGTAITNQGEDWEDRMPRSTRKDLQGVMQEVIATLEIPRCRTGVDPELLQAVLNFLSYADTTLLSEGPLVSSQDFFVRATEVIDAVYAQFDEEISVVNHRLLRR